ncbi:hypothetical protein AFIC_002318 [[Pseudomonas] carboxydohydrogena]|uniref:Uncharacterized protein n=1 Tax=Afipia carboxydohydrogena TaxID=290 RepID=A0ABY8BL92_AFICR|nr:hypothetical protein [[Pseudomonas] carboxydohydrogena]WEF50769.1 hypothetical protein AFIC_002318 [[Pseudomonas] carboxydohydrogena]
MKIVQLADDVKDGRRRERPANSVLDMGDWAPMFNASNGGL